MRVVVPFAVLLSFGVMSNPGAQAVYKWVDDDNVTHFSAQPPRGVDAERTAIRLQPSNRQARQERIEESAAQREASALRRQQNREQGAEEAAQVEKNSQIRAENCAKAKQRYETYSTSRRLYRELENGEREYLDDDELDAERAEAQQLVNDWCD